MATCRLCLEIPAEIYIFDSTKNLLPKFLSYCKLKMCKDDGLPKYVCIECVRKLEEVVRFINQCEESDWLLRSNLNVDCVSIDKKSDTDDEYETKEDSLDMFDDENNSTVLDNGENLKTEYIIKQDRIEDKNNSTVLNNTKNLKKQCSLKKEQVGDIKGMLCFVCGKLYPQGRCYLEHMRTHGERELTCDICPKKFCTKTALSAHKTTHRAVKKYKCEYCEKMFKQNHECNKHMNYVHRKSKSYPCKICDKIFYYPMGLKEHTTVHTRERKFECDKCKKCFITTYQFKSHLRVHTGERPYACKFCTKKFTMLQGLKEHVRLHTGEKPFKCPTCLKGFAQMGNMKSHFKYNHKEMDYKTAVKAARLKQSLL